MKILLLAIGKTDASHIKEGIWEYEKRMTRYVSYEMKIIPDIKYSKNLTDNLQKEKEGVEILAKLENNDFAILLDENGRQFTSIEFSKFISLKMLMGLKRLVFIIGGPYGFSEEVYKRSNYLISLSKMTFSHQMVRMIFAEQLYRAMTITKGEPYHHV